MLRCSACCALHAACFCPDLSCGDPPLFVSHPFSPPSLCACCSERGAETIKHFLFEVAKMGGDWKMEDVLEEEMEKIRQQVWGLFFLSFLP